MYVGKVFKDNFAPEARSAEHNKIIIKFYYLFYIITIIINKHILFNLYINHYYKKLLFILYNKIYYLHYMHISFYAYLHIYA